MNNFQIVCNFLILFIVLKDTNSQKNNVCNTFSGYIKPSLDKNCYYSPDAYKNTLPEIVSNHAKLEKYEVTTEDGYILTVYRIPKNNPKKVVILQHPLGGDAITWVSVGNKSLPYLLSADGFDVWMPSYRGTTISHKHVNLTDSDFKFWNWSFHEIGIYDHKAVIRFVSEKTNNTKLVLISFSMGTTSNLIYASLLPEESEKYVKVIISMAAPVYFKNIRSPLKYLTPLTPILRFVLDGLKQGGYHLTDQNFILSRIIFRYLCTKFPINVFASKISNFFLGKPSKVNGNDPTLFPLSLRLYPRGFSTKIIYHYSQFITSGGKFQYFDYGKRKNKKLYGTYEPPQYPIKNIRIPIYLIYSDADSSCTLKDHEYLYSQLPKKAKIYGKYLVKGFGHASYIFGKNREYVYDHIVKFSNNLK